MLCFPGARVLATSFKAPEKKGNVHDGSQKNMCRSQKFSQNPTRASISLQKFVPGVKNKK